MCIPAVGNTGFKMVCRGFACSKNCLCALNLLYTLVSLLLIGIAAWGIGFGLISSLRVVGVVIAVGIFLFLIALVGLIGAVKHHQVLLFFVSFFTTGSFTPIGFVFTLLITLFITLT